MIITHIANSGIQFHRFSFEIDPNTQVIPPIGFRERWDTENSRVFLDYAQYLPEKDIWVSKESLIKEGNLDRKGRLLDNINYALLQPLDEESDYFRITDIEYTLDLFLNKWLPVPYFRCNHSNEFDFGPTDWARLLIRPGNQSEGANHRLRTLDAVLVFDTKLAETIKDAESPFLWENSTDNIFGLCQDLDLILSYCDEVQGCGWVDDHLATLIHGGKNNIPLKFPSLKYLGNYIFLIKYLSTLKKTGSEDRVFPTVEIYNNEKPPIEVDLVLDIGNANTCGLLFETPSGKYFEFTSVKKLKLHDLTAFNREYDDPFAMNLVFSRCNFGEINFNSSKFQWPSVLRVGQEAAYLINRSIIDINRGIEAATYHSSPKRYLWDEAKFELQWEFIYLEGQRGPDPVYLPGISQQFLSDGRLTLKKDFGATSNFSRKSLMTFVFLEIFAQALCQINSHEFRLSHGNIDRLRKLRRVVITCPTAMIQKEQVALRRSAEEAAIVLKRFFNGTFDLEIDPATLNNELDVIPSVKDVGKDLTSISTRRDWSYDEATCCQLVFMYGEVAKRYLGKSETFFNLFGKMRSDIEGYSKKSVTVGSIDIGGGTTDLMICAYQYDETGIAVLTPKPLYWESFNLAGDDYLKKVVQEILLEGRLETELDRGSLGVIENHARSFQMNDISNKMNNFFGSNSNNIGYINRLMRKNFNTQVLVPIAKIYLEHARHKYPDKTVGFDELFPEIKPNRELLNFFEAHFGFRFEDLKWKLSTDRVNTILESTFEPLLKLIATLCHSYGTDFILLAGKPTSLSRVEELFLKFYPVSPDRIITLNKYRVGRWYPFADDSGYLNDPKTIVAVGALISLMGGRMDKLSGFRINQSMLISKIISTADYFGLYNPLTLNVESIFLTPDENRADIVVAGLPVMLGFKRLIPDNYPGRPIYLLDFNNAKLIERIKSQNPNIDERDIPEQVVSAQTQLKNRMPFTIRISRLYRENKEKLEIESVMDKNRDDSGLNSLLSLSVQTLSQEKGYWLDTGEFQLSIRD